MLTGIGSFNPMSYMQDMMSIGETEKRENPLESQEGDSLSSYFSGMDQVSFSTEALARLQQMQSSKDNDDFFDEEENIAVGQKSPSADAGSQIEQIKKQISDIQKKIMDAQQREMPDESKQAVINALESQLSALQQALTELESQAA